MEVTRSHTSFLLWALVALLLSQFPVSFASSSLSFQDGKNFFFFTPPSDPSITTPPSDPTITTPPFDPSINTPPPLVLSPPPSPVVLSPPPVDPGVTYPPPPTVSYGYPPPAGTPAGPAVPVGRTPPSPQGHHGGRHHHHHRQPPPANCGNPPTGHYNPSPAPPTRHNPSPAPPTSHDPYQAPPPPYVHQNPSPAPPTGGYHYSPPTTPATPSTPIVIPPVTPSINPPPFDPNTPPTPGITIPSPPFDPNSPPIGGTCNFWRTHPGLIWGLVGWWGTIGRAFGVPTTTSIPAGGMGENLNLLQALSNTRNDGIGALYREGTASLLNSMSNPNFPFSTSHVKTSFVSALASEKAAGAQAKVFKLANEGHMMKPRV